MKDTFIIRTEWYEAISELEPADQATILRNLFAYHIGQDVVLDTFGVRIVWKLIEPTLSRNVESYDRRKETNVINGKKGGRPAKAEINLNKTQINPNNQTVNKEETQKPIETLSDSVYVSDYVSDSECVENAHTPEKKEDDHLPAEKIKNIPAYALPAPGTRTDDDIYYEQEICMRHHIDRRSLENIHTAWLGDRLDTMYTGKEARLNFASYVAKWVQNNRSRPTNGSPPAAKKIIPESSYL